MPFTLSHAAAVLPGLTKDGTARGPLVASALVMGSFSPDLTYFAASVLPGAMSFGQFTHGLAGLLTVDVVITALLVGCWLMVRDPLVVLLPPQWQGRVHLLLRGRTFRPGLRSLLWFYLSAVLGAATHIGWDAFTHEGRWGTRLIPLLNETVAGFGVHKFAQYGSSALALAVLGAWLWSALRRLPPVPAPPSLPFLDRRGRHVVGLLLAGCLLIGAVQRCLLLYLRHEAAFSPIDLIPTACFGGGAGLVVGLLLYGAGLRLTGRTTTRV